MSPSLQEKERQVSGEDDSPIHKQKNSGTLHMEQNVKKELGMNLRFFESLCSTNESILKDCNKLKRDGVIYDSFIRNGFNKIVVKEGDKPKKIIHSEILYEMFPLFYEADG